MSSNRDRLIELIKKGVDISRNVTGLFSWGDVADYLLANGVIVSPLKIGDKIYQIFGNEIVKIEVLDVEIEFRSFVRKKYRYNYNAFTNDDFGKTVFLTKEEAEAALNNKNKGEN